MTWTGQNFSVGQVLTAAQMNNLQADITALANGDSGAPEIIQAAFKSTTAENTTTTTNANVDLTGGQFAFLLESKLSNAARITYSYGATSGTDANVFTQSTSYTTRMSFGSINADSTASIRHRYIQASPPYDLGDGDIPMFIFVVIDNATGVILATSSAPDAPWHYSGPTDIRPSHFKSDGVPQIATKDMSKFPFNFAEALKNDVKLATYAKEFRLAPTVYGNITQEIKQKDMLLHPTPNFQLLNDQGVNITPNTTVIMLAPVIDIIYDLAEMVELEGLSIGELLHDNRFIIDNTPSGLNGPPGILVPSFRWRNNP